MNKWIKTDDYQLIKKVDENIFEVIDAIIISPSKENPKNLVFFKTTVDVCDFNDEELQDILSAYYDYSIQEFKNLYSKDECWKQLIAECYAESYLLEGEKVNALRGEKNGFSEKEADQFINHIIEQQLNFNQI